MSTLKNNIVFKDWIYQSLKALKPPERLTVSQWAEKHRILDAKTSAEPGPWRNSRTPYLKGVMDAFNDPSVEEMYFIKPTQVGGTEGLLNIIGYIVSNNPAPTLVVYPTEKLAEYASLNRLQPMFKLCKSTREEFLSDSSKLLELRFNSMYLVLTGANSPSSLASMPMQDLILDEVDKFPTNSGKEADPISLARERTKTFVGNKKILGTSTPTFEHGHIWKAHLACDRWLEYYVPCPHCNELQTLKFPQLKWDNSLKTLKDIELSVYYECEFCKGKIKDRHKQEMLEAGEWEARERNNGNTKTSFRLNVLYSPWTRFGEVVKEFLVSKEDPEKLLNFVNSWLGEPWKDVNSSIDIDVVLERRTDLNEFVLPDDVLVITGGADVQEHCVKFIIRGWSEGMTSQLITSGECLDLEELEHIMNMPLYTENNRLFQVDLCAIDTGHKTDDVYDFCVLNSDWAIPVKGSSQPLTKRFNASTIDKKDSSAHNTTLYILDTAQYKRMIMSRLRKPNGRGSFMVHKDVSDDYCKQLISEHEVKTKIGNTYKFEWKIRPGYRHNHFLDCEVYSCLAGDLMNVRYITNESIKNNIQKQANNSDNQQQNSWLSTSGWLDKTQNWLNK